MKKYCMRKLMIFGLLLCALIEATGCAETGRNKQANPGTPPGELNQNALGGEGAAAAAYSRDLSKIDFSGVPFTPWDTAKAAKGLKERGAKPYTVLVYMNGSDLESEYGAATNDLVEMLKSGLKPEAANLIIFTGGTNRWRNNVVSASDCTLWEIAGGAIGKIADVGLRSMGDAGTLASFIDFGVKYCPAEKYGLIMWDHGGGSIAGYGHDEKFADGTLSLLKLNYAFEKSAIKQKPFEFIGFDACLMASVEMAVVAAPYAKYFIASEELEPGDGWNYGFLAALNGSPALDGAALGKVIVDTFMDFYGADYDGELSLSVVNLSNAGGVMAAAGALTAKCSDNLAVEKRASFNTLSRKRNNTKTFGEGSPRDNECDMVDAGDMAEKLKDVFPSEAGAVSAALNRCVVYNRHNSDINLCGLSAYYIYGGRKTADKSLSTYAALQVENNHAAYLRDFSGYLTAFPLSVTRFAGADETREARINGVGARAYKISRGKGYELFAVPVSYNGRDADVIISVCGKYPQGGILGIRKQEGFIVQKGYDKIGEGDKISFYCMESERQITNYKLQITNEDGEVKWRKSDEITVKGGLAFDWAQTAELCA